MNDKNLVPIKNFKIADHRRLNYTVIVPSASHNYALAVEYIQKWFLSKFQKNFFKTVYIEGKHIFDESRKFNIDKTARRQNPAVAIIPSIDFSFDRDKVDLRLAGLDLYEGRSMYSSSFFRDFDNSLYIKQIDQLNLLNFTIRVYLDTKAKQLNMWQYMKLAFRVGLSQGEYIDMDFAIPEEVILQLAIDAGFKVDLENRKVKDVVKFLNYLNRKSVFPILYKLRCENGRDEFFVRMTGEYVHIAIPDALSVDDGDRVGHTYESFPIEMNLTLRFPGPQAFVYMSKKHHKVIEGTKLENSNDVVGLYSLKVMDIPNTNEKGWNIYIESEFEDYEERTINIPLNEIFDYNVLEVLKYTIEQYISPKIFIDIKIYDVEQNLVDYDIDWDKLKVSIDNSSKKYDKTILAIYVDTKYLNDNIVTMNNSTNTRMNDPVKKLQ